MIVWKNISHFLHHIILMFQVLHHIILNLSLLTPHHPESLNFSNMSVTTDVHPHQSLNPECRWRTTDDLATRYLHICLSSAALCVSEKSRSVHSLMLSSHLFLCLLLLAPLTVPCGMVFVKPDVRETCPYHFSFRLFTVGMRSP